MTEKSTHTMLELLLEEHKEVAEQIADLKQFWSEVHELGQGPKYEEMGIRIRDLREVLAKHFAEEEHEGYLSPALKRAPQFAAQAEQLKQQHQQFLNTLDHFIERLQACESAYHCWQEVGEEFDDFLKRLHEHESAETMIVKTADAS